MKPKVYKARDRRFLVIIYNDHEETYDFKNSATFKELTKERGPGADEYTRYDSEELCQNSDMKEVHFTDEIKAHGIVCNCGDIDKNIDMGIKGCKCKIVDDNGKTLQEIDVDFAELKK